MSLADYLLKDGIIAMNSDTIGGLFVKYENINGVKEIIKLKKRSPEKFFQVYISDYKMLKQLGIEKEATGIIKKILPGPFTLIVRSKINLPYITKNGYIGIRFINNKIINKMIQKTGPLVATSLNISGKKTASLDYYKKIFTSVYFGNMKSVKKGIPSTVVKYIDNGNFEVLRQGVGNIGKLNVNTVIGSDHGGYKMKEYIKKILNKMKITFADMGTFNEDSVDYPDYAHLVAKSIQKHEAEKGILICGTGIGMSIAANRFKNVRAALCHNEDYVRLARQHNDANIIALGGRFLPFKKVEGILKVFFNTHFEGGRHLRRISKIEKI